MIYLKTGNTWDFKYLEELDRLNNIDPDNIKIYEVYGSLNDCPVSSARPKFRIPERKDKNFLKDYVSKANEYKININYTINLMCIGSKNDLKDREKKLLKYIEYLIECNIKDLTIAHPLLIRLIKDKFPEISITLSTIADLAGINQLYDYKELGIEKICMNVNKNREFDFLKRFNIHAKENNIIVELIVNEFCTFNCIHRDSCFLLHSHTTTDDKFLYDNYPMNICMNLKKEQPYEWLKARFIRPEDMKHYVFETDINHFKITGRTFPTKIIVPIIESYIDQRHSGNLLDLWCHLENIGDEQNYKKNSLYIPNSKMGDFIKPWVENVKFDCNTACMSGCTYCIKYFYEITEEYKDGEDEKE